MGVGPNRFALNAFRDQLGADRIDGIQLEGQVAQPGGLRIAGPRRAAGKLKSSIRYSLVQRQITHPGIPVRAVDLGEQFAAEDVAVEPLGRLVVSGDDGEVVHPIEFHGRSLPHARTQSP